MVCVVYLLKEIQHIINRVNESLQSCLHAKNGDGRTISEVKLCTVEKSTAYNNMQLHVILSSYIKSRAYGDSQQ